MSTLTAKGKKRYEILRPKWIRDFFPDENPVQNSEELYEEVKKVLKEQMINQKKVCTLLDFTLEEDEISGVDEGSHSIPMVEDYSCDKLIERFERATVMSKMTAVRMRFEQNNLSDDLTWIIIVCNN